MAAPVMLGLPVIMGFLLKLLEWIVAKFVAVMSARMAMSLAWVTFYIALLSALALAMSAIVTGLSGTLPSDLAQGFGMVKPGNFEACVAAIYSAKITMWVFHQKKQLIDWERMTGGYGRAGRIL